jgi:hypothetical protein
MRGDRDSNPGPSGHMSLGATEHVPGQHCAAYQIRQSLNSMVGYGDINSKAGDGHPVPEGLGNKTRQHQYSLSCKAIPFKL